MPEPIVTEASMLDWEPGEWPFRTTIDGVKCTFKRAIRADGELIAVVYKVTERPEQEIHVLND